MGLGPGIVAVYGMDLNPADGIVLGAEKQQPIVMVFVCLFCRKGVLLYLT